MSIQKMVSDQLKKDGIYLNEDDIGSVIKLFNTLAKIEYEVYREQKSINDHCQSTERQDLGTEENRRAA
jgi:hypothetical protein